MDNLKNVMDNFTTYALKNEGLKKDYILIIS